MNIRRFAVQNDQLLSQSTYSSQHAFRAKTYSIVLRNHEKIKGKEQRPGLVVHACRNPSYLGSRD
jgi:hypothetical protein